MNNEPKPQLPVEYLELLAIGSRHEIAEQIRLFLAKRWPQHAR